MSNNLKIESKINTLGISETEKSSLITELLSVKKLVNSNDIQTSKFNRTLLYTNEKRIKQNMAFFYAVNYTYKKVFEHIDFSELQTILIDTSAYEARIDEFNRILESLLENENQDTKDKFLAYCQPIDCSNLKPMDEAFFETLKTELNFTDNKFETYIGGMQEFSINLGNTILFQAGELN